MSDELILEIDPPYIGSAVSPTVDITETTTDVTVTITDFQGDHSYTIEKTDQAIADAEQAASNANTAAANATSTANQAAQYARTTADQAAADAQATADAAAGRADTAAASATSAAQAATTAASNANTAAQNADAKAALADSKAALANQAATTANQAAQAAEAAKTAANTAAGQATTAAGNANTAAGTANTAATNADAKAALADTAAANADTATANANTATTAATNAAQAANNAADYAIEAADDMPKLVNTASGTTAQTVNDAWPTTPESAVLYGKSVQNGTPTPENPIPVQVVGGRNLLPPHATGTVTSKGVTATYNNDGSISLSGTATDTTFFYPVQQNFMLKAGTYTISTNTLVNGSRLVLGFANKGAYPFWLAVDTSQTFTLNADDTLISGNTFLRIDSGKTVDVIFSLQLEAGTQATPYTPYGCIGLQTGETVTHIDLEGHVLAGLQNNVRDELDVDAAGVKKIAQRVGIRQFDGTETWLKDTSVSSRVQFYCTDNTVNRVADYRQAMLCDMLEIAQNSYMTNMPAYAITAYHNQQGRYPGQNWWYIRIDGITDVASLKTWLAEHTPTVYYELATPVTHSLGTLDLPELTNPCELAIYASLDPEWAIEYEQDPNIVVTALQSSIAPVEGATASTNYAVGAYLMHGNQLYRVTSAIATGEAITPGSNCVACTVMGEVIRLTA